LGTRVRGAIRAALRALGWIGRPSAIGTLCEICAIESFVWFLGGEFGWCATVLA